MSHGPRNDLDQLVTELLEHVAELRRQYAELHELLATDAQPPSLEAEGEPAAAGDTGSHPARDPIQLIAIEMALLGRTRDEVETYLRDAYGVAADPGMLDSVFSRAGR